MALFDPYERRIDKINSVLSSYGIASLEAEKNHKRYGLDIKHGKGIQPICFEVAAICYRCSNRNQKGARKTTSSKSVKDFRLSVSLVL